MTVASGSSVRIDVDLAGRRRHLLEVVEHDEVASPTARERESLERRDAAVVAHPERPGDGRQHAPGSRTCSRATNVTRSNRSRASRAASIASRVLPIPPGPTSVTSRRGSSPPSHSSSVMRSVSRPSTSSGGSGRCSAASSAAAVPASPAAARAALAAAGDAGTAAADDAAEHLPVPPDEVLGRETDVETLLEWLGGENPRRLVTLVGPGGIGKTRLAIEAARLARDRFDRVTFVALEHVRDANGVLPAVARALGVHDDGSVPTLERLARARRGRRDLIVLDNFEQVVSAAPQVDVDPHRAARRDRHGDEPRAAPGARGAGVRCRAAPPSARIPTRVSLAEIADAPAVGLFLDRAHAADARFHLTVENAEDVARICRTLDGVPLAIELAAACIRVLTPAAMLAKLDQVLPILKISDRDMPERQRTIRATVEWSIDLLGPFARALFMRLGVFVGDFSIDAVEAVAGGQILGPLTCPAPCSSSSTAACCASTRSEASPSSRCSSRFASSRRCGSPRDPDADAVRRAHAALLRAPRRIRSNRCCADPRSRPRWSGSRRRGHDVRVGVHSPHRRSARSTRSRMPRGGCSWYWWIRNLLPTAKSWTDRLLESGVPLHGSKSRDRDHVLVLGLPRAPGHRSRSRGAADRGGRDLPRRRRPIR